MKKVTKSSITLPPEELKLMAALQRKLRSKSKVDVVRGGLRLLRDTTECEALREAYRHASLSTREGMQGELEELDFLTDPVAAMRPLHPNE